LLERTANNGIVLAGGCTGTTRDLVVWSAVNWTAHSDKCSSVKTSRGPIRWHSYTTLATRKHITAYVTSRSRIQYTVTVMYNCAWQLTLLLLL